MRSKLTFLFLAAGLVCVQAPALRAQDQGSNWWAQDKTAPSAEPEAAAPAPTPAPAPKVAPPVETPKAAPAVQPAAALAAPAAAAAAAPAAKPAAAAPAAPAAAAPAPAATPAPAAAAASAAKLAPAPSATATAAVTASAAAPAPAPTPAPAAAAPAAAAVAAPAPAPTPAPAAVVAPAAAVGPVAAAVPAAAAPVTKAAPAASDSVNAASYTSGIGKLYDDLATEAKAFTAKAHEQVAALKKTEADIEAKLEATTKDLADAKAHETRASRTWFGFGESKAVKAIEEKQGLLEEELATARKETQRHVSSIIDQLWEMQKWNIVAIKAKYKDVAGLVSAAK